MKKKTAALTRKTAVWLIPLCHFAATWHNGQGRPAPNERVSYRLLSLSLMAARRRGCLFPLDIPLTEPMKAVYRHLEETYCH